jgi:hypothetical protein
MREKWRRVKDHIAHRLEHKADGCGPGCTLAHNQANEAGTSTRNLRCGLRPLGSHHMLVRLKKSRVTMAV